MLNVGECKTNAHFVQASSELESEMNRRLFCPVVRELGKWPTSARAGECETWGSRPTETQKRADGRGDVHPSQPPPPTQLCPTSTLKSQKELKGLVV